MCLWGGGSPGQPAMFLKTPCNLYGRLSTWNRCVASWIGLLPGGFMISMASGCAVLLNLLETHTCAVCVADSCVWSVPDLCHMRWLRHWSWRRSAPVRAGARAPNPSGSGPIAPPSPTRGPLHCGCAPSWTVTPYWLIRCVFNGGDNDFFTVCPLRGWS